MMKPISKEFHTLSDAREAQSIASGAQSNARPSTVYDRGRSAKASSDRISHKTEKWLAPLPLHSLDFAIDRHQWEAAAMQHTQHFADRGDAEAQYRLGLHILHNPTNDNADHSFNGVYWLREAAKRNHPKALLLLTMAKPDVHIDLHISEQEILEHAAQHCGHESYKALEAHLRAPESSVAFDAHMAAAKVIGDLQAHHAERAIALAEKLHGAQSLQAYTAYHVAAIIPGSRQEYYTERLSKLGSLLSPKMPVVQAEKPVLERPAFPASPRSDITLGADSDVEKTQSSVKPVLKIKKKKKKAVAGTTSLLVHGDNVNQTEFLNVFAAHMKPILALERARILASPELASYTAAAKQLYLRTIQHLTKRQEPKRSADLFKTELMHTKTEAPTLKQLAKRAIDLALTRPMKTDYDIDTAIGSIRKTADWQNQIQRLAQELKIFKAAPLDSVSTQLIPEIEQDPQLKKLLFSARLTYTDTRVTLEKAQYAHTVEMNSSLSISQRKARNEKFDKFFDQLSVAIQKSGSDPLSHEQIRTATETILKFKDVDGFAPDTERFIQCERLSHLLLNRLGDQFVEELKKQSIEGMALPNLPVTHVFERMFLASDHATSKFQFLTQPSDETRLAYIQAAETFIESSFRNDGRMLQPGYFQLAHLSIVKDPNSKFSEALVAKPISSTHNEIFNTNEYINTLLLHKAPPLSQQPTIEHTKPVVPHAYEFSSNSFLQMLNPDHIDQSLILLDKEALITNWANQAEQSFPITHNPDIFQGERHGRLKQLGPDEFRYIVHTAPHNENGPKIITFYPLKREIARHILALNGIQAPF